MELTDFLHVDTDSQKLKADQTFLHVHTDSQKLKAGQKWVSGHGTLKLTLSQKLTDGIN